MNSKVKHGSKPAFELQGIQFNEQFRKSMHLQAKYLCFLGFHLNSKTLHKGIKTLTRQ